MGAWWLLSLLLYSGFTVFFIALVVWRYQSKKISLSFHLYFIQEIRLHSNRTFYTAKICLCLILPPISSVQLPFPTISHFHNKRNSLSPCLAIQRNGNIQASTYKNTTTYTHNSLSSVFCLFFALDTWILNARTVLAF